MTINVFTGPRCRFTLNGTTIALARNVSAQDEVVYEPIEVLDNLEVLDHEPVGYRASMSAAEFMVVGKTLEALGFIARKGQTPQQHMRNLLALNDIVAQLEDNTGEIVVARAFGVRIASRSFGVDARGMVARDLQLVARRLVEADEAI